MDDMPEYRSKKILIFGCGNILLGDDGFGPAVIEELEKNYQIPEHVFIIDAGSSIREFLFNIALDEVKPDVPLVARLVGTNEEEGRAILSGSPYPLITAKTLAEAAQKAVSAAQNRGAS